MVNPIKFITRATGISKISEGYVQPHAAPTAPTSTPAPQEPAAPTPTPPPVMGTEPAPTRPGKKARRVPPSLVGGAVAAGVGAASGGKTLLGQ